MRAILYFFVLAAAVWVAGCSNGTSSPPVDTAAPVANAGEDLRVPVGDYIALDASRSFDSDNDALTYTWQIVGKPNNSNATIINPSRVNAQLDVDIGGRYEVELTVSDGYSSASDIKVVDGVAEPEADAPFLERYSPYRRGEPKQQMLLLPGASEATLITYEVLDGLAIFQGDIMLGRVEDLSSLTSQGIGVEDKTKLWPFGTVYYQVSIPDDNQLNPLRPRAALKQSIERAISHWQAKTDLDFVERTNEVAYVDFVLGEGCAFNADIAGRQRGRQEIQLSTRCSEGAVIHEIGHAIGLWHEQSRSDRDLHVEILEDNIQANTADNDYTFQFDKVTSARDLGSYDFDSVMHYQPYAFAKEDEACYRGITTRASREDLRRVCTIIPVSDDIDISRLGQRDKGLSEGDIRGVEQLYPTFSFGGKLTNAENRQAVAGATVKWGIMSTVSDSGGNYRFDKIACGRETLSVTAPGFETYSEPYEPPCLPEAQKNIILTPAGDDPAPDPLPAPRVSGVSPDPVVGSNERQWISIIGSDFEANAVVTLRAQTDVDPFSIPPERTKVINQSKIDVYVNVTTQPDTWTAEVENPDGQTSSRVSFNVIAPSEPGGRWKVDPKVLTFRSIDGVVPNPQTFTLTNTGGDASSYFVKAGDADHYVPALYSDLVDIPDSRGVLTAGESASVTVIAEKCWGWGEAYTANTIITIEEGNDTETLQVTQECLVAPTPKNDDFANATVLTGNSGELYGTNAGATDEPGEPDIGPSDDFFESYGWTTWYRWTAPVPGLVTFAFEEIKDLLFDYDWRIYEGPSLSSLKEVTATSQYNYPRVTKEFQVVAGKTYHIRVGGAYFDAEGYYFGEFILGWALR